jgi:phage tail sheath protein FI
MPDYLAPGVFIEEISFRAKTIDGVSTTTAAFVGETERGSVTEARLITSYDEFKQHYGMPLKDRHLARSVQLFFANGGSRLYIARVDTKPGSALEERPYQQAFRLFDPIDDISLIAVPGVGPASMIEFAAVYCRTRQDCFFIADVPSSVNSVAEAQQVMKSLRDTSSYAACYFPWLSLKEANTRSVVQVPPSGAVAGVYARIDTTRAVWNAPAGTQATVRGVAGLAFSVSDKEQELLNPLGLNVIRDNVAPDMVVWGARTLAKNEPEFRYVPVRRTAIYLEKSIKQGIQWAVFEPNDAALWSQLKEYISSFMYATFVAGAFAGSKSDEAFFVKCDGETTTQADIDNGVVTIQVGFAPLRPAEFVVFQIQQKTGQTV